MTDAKSRSSVWVHASTLMHWNRPPVGIVRVEQEYCRWLIEREGCGSQVRFCTYDAREKAFLEADTEQIAAKLGVRPAHSGFPAGKGDSRQVLKPARFRRHDKWVSLGLGWDYQDNAYVLQDLKHRHGLRTTFICYDIVPILFPHLAVVPFDQFASYFLEMAWAADTLLCISESTRRDCERQLNLIGAPVPPTRVIRLGADFRNEFNVKTPAGMTHTGERPFVLFVSTIERRKNHDLLYKAWVRLREMNIVPHKLVLVGMEGWGVSDLLKDIREDPRIAGDITILSDVSDEELAWLYRNAAFTVYPSLYEGWGLPVVESLAAGKFCLSSNAASLPEAGGKWAEYLDPWDVPGWVDRLRHYMENPQEVEALNGGIRQEFRPPKWEETAAQIHEAVVGSAAVQ